MSFYSSNFCYSTGCYQPYEDLAKSGYFKVSKVEHLKGILNFY